MRARLHQVAQQRQRALETVPMCRRCALVAMHRVVYRLWVFPLSPASDLGDRRTP